MLIQCRKIDVDFRNKERQTKIELLEEWNREFEEFENNKKLVEERGEEFTEVFEKEKPDSPEVEIDMDLQEAERNN